MKMKDPTEVPAHGTTWADRAVGGMVTAAVFMLAYSAAAALRGQA